MRMYYVIEETMRQQQRELEQRAERYATGYGDRAVRPRRRSTRLASRFRTLRPASRRTITCARAAGLARCA